MNKKFCRRISVLVFTIMVFMPLLAQYKPLKIDDSIPEELWQTPLQMVNSELKTTNLSPYRDKLLLIDFWATWCASCLRNFPKMSALEQRFGDQLKVVPVSRENRADLEKFFMSKNGKRYNDVQSVSDDSMLHKVFPHVALPFIVWIYDGKVINTTDAEQVTESTIREILEGKKSSLQTVLQIGRDRPMMLAEQFDLERNTNLMNYAILTKGRMKAIAPGTGFHRSNGVVHGRQWSNMSLMNIYRGIAYEIFAAKGDLFSEKRIDNQVSDLSEIEFTFHEEDESRNDELYSIDFIVPTEKAESLYPEMLSTLSNFSGYTGTIEKQLKKCLVLKINSKTDLLKSGGGVPFSKFTDSTMVMRNVPIEFLTVALNVDQRFTSLPVIDESGYLNNVDINLGVVPDLNTLRKSLRKYGIVLEEEERQIKMLVIRKDPVKAIHK